MDARYNLDKISIKFWDEIFYFYIKYPSMHSLSMIQDTIKDIQQLQDGTSNGNNLDVINRVIESSVKFINSSLITGRDRSKTACSTLFGTDDTSLYQFQELVDIVDQITSSMKQVYHLEDASPEAAILNA